MFCIHKIYKLQVKPTDTTSINLGICCKIPFFRAFTVSDYSRSQPESRSRCVKTLCLSCLWAQAKRSVQAASASLLEASGAECKEHFEALCLSLTCSVNAGSTRSHCGHRLSFTQMEPTSEVLRKQSQSSETSSSLWSKTVFTCSKFPLRLHNVRLLQMLFIPKPGYIQANQLWRCSDLTFSTLILIPVLWESAHAEHWSDAFLTFKTKCSK